jgi:enamine deaminase RidA (YjgF/YER057c/UK114 family)
MDSVSYHNPAQLHSNPAFTQAVRIPAGHDLIVISGQNGVDSAGLVVSGDLAGQARQALINLQACLREANADLDHVIRWSIMIKDGAPLQMALPPSWRSGAGGTIHLLSPSQWSAASQVRGPCAKSMRSRPSRVPNAARRLRETAHHSDEW